MAKNPRAAAQPTSPAKAGSISARVIGIPEILADGAPVTLRYRKAEALVYFLVIEARRVSRSEVIALLWPELPAATGAANLRGVLTELRGVLGPRLLADPRASWISLAQVGSDLADLAAWNETLHDSRTVPGAWTDLLTQDTLLDGFSIPDNEAFTAWRTEAQHRFEDQLQALRLEAVNHALERDATSIALELLERSLTKEPWNEALAIQVARLHVTWGTPSRAVAALDTAIRAVPKELGVDVDPETLAFRDAARRLNRHGLRRARTFYGRHAEVDRIQALLAEDSAQLITVFGPEGTGVSEILTVAAEAHAASVSCRVNRLDATRPSLPEPSRAHDILDILIIDPFVDSEAVRTWLEGVRSSNGGHHVLVGARAPLEVPDEHLVKIGPLPVPPSSIGDPAALGTNPSVGLLRDLVAARSSNASAQRDLPRLGAWARACKGHPASLVRVAAWLARPENAQASPSDAAWSMVTLVPEEDLQRASEALDALDGDARDVLFTVARLQGASTITMLSEILDTNASVVRNALETGTTMGWLQPSRLGAAGYEPVCERALTLRALAATHPRLEAIELASASRWLRTLEPLSAPELGAAERELSVRALDHVDDIETAIAVLRRRSPVEAIRLTVYASTLYRALDRPSTVVDVLAPLLATHSDELTPEEHVLALNALAVAHAFAGTVESALPLQRSAVERADATGDPYLTAQARLNLGFMAILQGDAPEAATLFERAFEIASHAELPWMAAAASINLGHAWRRAGKHVEALGAYQRGVRAMAEQGDTVSECAGSLGIISACAYLVDTQTMGHEMYRLDTRLAQLPFGAAQGLKSAFSFTLSALVMEGLAAPFEKLLALARRYRLA